MHSTFRKIFHDWSVNVPLHFPSIFFLLSCSSSAHLSWCAACSVLHTSPAVCEWGEYFNLNMEFAFVVPQLFSECVATAWHSYHVSSELYGFEMKYFRLSIIIITIICTYWYVHWSPAQQNECEDAKQIASQWCDAIAIWLMNNNGWNAARNVLNFHCLRSGFNPVALTRLCKNFLFVCIEYVWWKSCAPCKELIECTFVWCVYAVYSQI